MPQISCSTKNSFPAGSCGRVITQAQGQNEKENLNKIPKDLPVYIFAGDKDPVGDFGKGIINLYECYKALGIKDLKYKLYKNGRHEMLNENNKDEVIEDILNWINNII